MQTANGFQNKQEIKETTANLPEPVRAGLIGRGIQQSRTPRMHEREAERLGFSYRYSLFDMDLLGLKDDDFPSLMLKLKEDGYSGLNITHPFKQQVIACLDDLSPNGQSIGAVNTVVFRDGLAIGHNTDCWGFAESFSRGLPVARLDSVVLLGAGGAGMAVAKALLDLGAKVVTVCDVDLDRAERLAARLSNTAPLGQVSAALDPASAIASADGVVNATPVGMAKYPGIPIDPSLLRCEMWVADIIYFPEETQLLETARQAECQVLSGAGMAIFQAVRAFELITGMVPDSSAMTHHFHTG